ncbi:MAG: class I SAM-dependent methyltransferase [Solidesulfovibrio sp.]|uniref:class I SAM-dependent methyltransferase n=1 Tax=Solidesulfovibrio sp. TaxID=2910990 RepID=UPI002B1FEDF8|nr:class I SAM-dependent methyltransferase [Solidesulfovibrio sp.]MEA4857798.1 class I SAM-dependent methyltransferase [Solidesulfovibrio sp.]
MDACPADALHGYYRWHARIYDATRWSFLFGRDRLVRRAAEALGPRHDAALRVVEVGCGTGRNLRRLAGVFPGAGLTGIDLCRPMIDRARRAVAGQAGRVDLVCEAYAPGSFEPASADLIVFSYSLSMFNPGFEAALDAARGHLAPGGLVAVADFRHSPRAWFRAWMGVNHVRLDDQLLPELTRRFAVTAVETRPAYGGLWTYFLFLGRRGTPRTG